jgi:D-alanine transaminase
MSTNYQHIEPELPSTICYLNGVFCPINEAKISVLDRGFIFGDGVYEVVPIYFGQPFRFEHHMQRLERSLNELKIVNPFSRVEWLNLILELVSRYAKDSHTQPSSSNQIVYLQLSRGAAPRDHVMTQGISPTVFMMTNPLKSVPEDIRLAGVKCVSADDFRWEKAHIKSTSLLGAVLSRQISADAGATETIMFRDGFLSEASSSNVWIVKNSVLIAPPKNNLVLEGIRYGLLEEICQESGISYELRPISKEEVFSADEVMLSSASKEVLAVSQIDDSVVGAHTSHAGKPGPIYLKLYTAYQNKIAHSCKSITSV